MREQPRIWLGSVYQGSREEFDRCQMHQTDFVTTQGSHIFPGRTATNRGHFQPNPHTLRSDSGHRACGSG